MRRVLRLPGLLACIVALAPLQAVVVALAPRSRLAAALPMAFHRMACRVLGLRVDVHGTPSTAAGTVWLSNHLSYLDICVLGGLLPGRFVAKHEVRGWPLFGALSRLQRTLFIGRRTVDSTQALDAMGQALAEPSSLILFPEGTTTDGSRVLPFRSSAFAPLLATANGARVLQPVTLQVLDDGAAERASPYAYHGDDVLGPHLLAFMTRPATRIRVTLHPPLPVADAGPDRKAAARRMHGIVAAPLSVPSPGR